MRITLPAVELPHRPFRSVTHLLILALVSLMVPGCPGRAATPATRPAHTTFIVFAQYHMPEAQWDDLLGALRHSLVASEPEGSGRASVDILRGDRVAWGLPLQDEVVSIYLHGGCVLLPSPRITVTGALGWVYRIHGRIQPVIHVACTELSQMIGPMALTLTTSRRHQIMAEAIARVVMHEWVHIATQSAVHTSHGISKSTFGIADLLADDQEYRQHPARFRSRRWPLT